ncbi:hypothetical protein MNBD_NITROSPINAE01-520 [hydrothermal vent metagenome]|uniref:Response regulatory domain-containing protein n=1 Tax=hydrothermal vent metagenome TaxID=652676 RepID=A0A3B1BKQ1_9ZZZZ
MNRTVILGEDEKNIATLIRFKLTKIGLNVKWFATGPEILDAVIANPPDLLLLDLMLPGMTGFEIVENLRKEKATATLPIILLSAKGQKADIERGLGLGATEYMMKPFDMNDLVATINKYLPAETTEKAKDN